MTDSSTAPALGDAELDELENILNDLHERDEDTPQWEFCDGFLTALACTRRPVATHEWLTLLVGDGAPLVPADDADLPLVAPFADLAQQRRFVQLCMQRMAQVREQLDGPAEHLDDEQAFHPEVIDMRTLAARLPEAERKDIEGEPIPSLGQLWALGFICAVEDFEDDWQPPRDREQAGWLDDALGLVEALVDDDEGEPVANLYDEEPPHGISAQRLDAFGEAIWAVYDLRELWRSLGPRVDPIYKDAKPGRNDPCPCGSGKKYKKCCGA
ncbi:hypothetical protein GCM10022279_20640 [Comamonas faecalis]|uniref:Uncharacterized protein n=1 Tax=Comamonas faecalis TaxID=1387849 RepID=A0ABP7RG18_9BURK